MELKPVSTNDDSYMHIALAGKLDIAGLREAYEGKSAA